MKDKTLANRYRELLLLRIKVAEAEKEAAEKNLQHIEDKQKERERK